jgi:hypothetical protein
MSSWSNANAVENALAEEYDPPAPYPTVVPAAAVHACIDAKHDVGTRHEDGVLDSATCHTCGTVYARGRVGSGEPTEEAPMSLVEREESTLAGRLGMARARYEGALIAVHEAEVEGRDIHAQQPRRKPPRESLAVEVQDLRRGLRFIVGALSDVDGMFLPDESFGGLVGEIFRAMTDAGLNPNDFIRPGVDHV